MFIPNNKERVQFCVRVTKNGEFDHKQYVCTQTNKSHLWSFYINIEHSSSNEFDYFLK